MTQELIKRTIDGEEYEFQKFGAKQSLRVLLRLTKIVGEPMALAINSVKGNGPLLDRNINGEVLAMAVRALTNQMDENVVLDLIEELTAKDNVLCGGKKINFNTHYEGKIPHLFKVLSAALAVQYENFFADLLGLVKLQQPSSQASPTPQ